MSENLDRRARRTRRVLWEALWSLLRDHDWAAISVQMICDRADVARSTFYAHYDTRQDLLDEGFAGGESQLALIGGETGVRGTIDWLVAHLAESAAFHRRFQGSVAGLAIMARFRALIRDRLAADFAASGPPADMRDLDFATGGLFQVLDVWLAGGCREPQAELATRLLRQVSATVSGGGAPQR